MILKYRSRDEDLKFIFYYLNQETKFIEGDILSLTIEDLELTTLDEIIEKIFILNNETADSKKIVEFKKSRIAPRPIKSDINILTLINYINLIRYSLEEGTLKYKDYIDQITLQLKIKFDPNFYFLEIKSGYINSIKSIEGMDKLYCEDVQADKLYQICSGLRNYYKESDLEKKTFLFLLNIKNIKFQKYESEGMICCAKDNENIEALQVYCDYNEKITLEGQLDLFKNIIYKKIDFNKKKYRGIFESFKIINNHLCFNGTKVLCGGKYITTKLSNGVVS